MQVENTDLQSANAFRQGQYGLVNLRYYPFDQVLIGIEYQYGKRANLIVRPTICGQGVGR